MTTPSVWICLDLDDALRIARCARRGVRHQADAECVDELLAQLDAPVRSHIPEESP